MNRALRAACLAASLAAGTLGAQAPAAARATGPTIGLGRAGAARIGRLPGLALTQTTGGTTKPPIEPARVAGEVLAGAYAGIGGYFVGSWAGSMIGAMLPAASDGTRDQISFGFGIVGATLATAASVSAVGNIGDQTGSYPTALAGTVGGVAVGLLLNQLLYGHARLPEEHGSSRVRWIEASLEALLPSLGASIAFTSTRRYK